MLDLYLNSNFQYFLKEFCIWLSLLLRNLTIGISVGELHFKDIGNINFPSIL